MPQDAVDNLTVIQGMIDSQYGLLLQEQTVYSSLSGKLAALQAAGVNDTTAKSESDPEGSTSLAFVSITQQLNDSVKRLGGLTEELNRLMRLQNNRFPFIRIRR